MTRTVSFRYRSGEYQAGIGPGGRVHIEDSTFTVHASRDGTVRLEGAGAPVIWIAAEGDTRWVFLDGRVYEFEVQRQGAPRRRPGGHHGSLSAPMPATVRRINVAAGDAVARGDILLVLEAMKMELPVRATAAGIVEAVHCREGDLVPSGMVLVEMEES